MARLAPTAPSSSEIRHQDRRRRAARTSRSWELLAAGARAAEGTSRPGRARHPPDRLYRGDREQRAEAVHDPLQAGDAQALGAADRAFGLQVRERLDQRRAREVGAERRAPDRAAEDADGGEQRGDSGGLAAARLPRELLLRIGDDGHGAEDPSRARRTAGRAAWAARDRSDCGPRCARPGRPRTAAGRARARRARSTTRRGAGARAVQANDGRRRRDCRISCMEGFGGFFNDPDFQKRLQEMAEQMQSSQSRPGPTTRSSSLST